MRVGSACAKGREGGTHAGDWVERDEVRSVSTRDDEGDGEVERNVGTEGEGGRKGEVVGGERCVVEVVGEDE